MIEMKIIVDDQGQCRVEGPIDQRMLCYGMLEIARDAIALYHDQQQKRIQPASVIPPNLKGVN